MSTRGPKVGVVSGSADFVRSLRPADHLDRKGLIRVGFWRGPQEKDLALPDPKDLVDEEWDEGICKKVFSHVELGDIVASYRGYSRCRICGKPNGSQERSDGKYIWPSGFGHYIMAHRVKPSEAFIEHVLHAGRAALAAYEASK